MSRTLLERRPTAVIGSWVRCSSGLLLVLAVGLICAPVACAQWGAVDPTFQPGSGNNSGLDGDVFAIAVQPDNKILIGGTFTKVGRTSRNGVARLNPDGSLDSTFDPGAGANGLVHALTLMPDGRVAVGGRFSAVNGAVRPYLARLEGSGELDPTFSSSPNNYVLAAAASADGKLLIGGLFTAVNGTVRSHVARINAEGSLDLEFAPTVDANVFAVASGADGAVWIAGVFKSVNGLERKGVARLRADGTVDGSFDPGAGANDVITALALQTDGRAVVGGAFTNYALMPIRYVARVMPTGGADETFTPGIEPVWGGVLSLQVDLAGRIVVGGEFYRVEGEPRAGIVRLLPDGRLDRTFDPGTGIAYSGDFSPLVRVVTLQPDGRVLLGGRFTSVDGVKLDYIARLTGEASGPLRFTAVERLDTDRVRLILAAPDGATCVLQGSLDLQQWTAVQTNLAVGGQCVFEPPDLVSGGRRLYRALRP